MKKILILFLIAFASVTSAQKVIKFKRASGHSFHIWGNDFEGVIFKENFEPFKSDSLGRVGFTPSPADVEFTEQLLRQKIDTAKCSIYITGDTVGKNLKYYVRQYFGYFNEKGEKIIFIDCFYRFSDVYPEKNIG